MEAEIGQKAKLFLGMQEIGIEPHYTRSFVISLDRNFDRPSENR